MSTSSHWKRSARCRNLLEERAARRRAKSLHEAMSEHERRADVRAVAKATIIAIAILACALLFFGRPAKAQHHGTQEPSMVLTVPIPTAPGWHSASVQGPDGVKNFDVYVNNDGYGVARNMQSGDVLHLDTKTGGWRDNKMQGGSW